MSAMMSWKKNGKKWSTINTWNRACIKWDLGQQLDYEKSHQVSLWSLSLCKSTVIIARTVDIQTTRVWKWHRALKLGHIENSPGYLSMVRFASMGQTCMVWTLLFGLPFLRTPLDRTNIVVPSTTHPSASSWLNEILNYSNNSTQYCIECRTNYQLAR